MQISDLPNSVREIADVIGVEQALRLINSLPMCDSGKDGRRKVRPILYVPKKLPADHRLVQILGWHDAYRLTRVFGGEILYPANLRETLEAERNKFFRRMVAIGFRPEVLADLVGVSERGMRKMCRAEHAPEEAEPQSVQSDADTTDGERHGL